MNAEIPDLELKCSRCEGEGGDDDPEYGWVKCSVCDRAGYVATPFGRRILSLVRHNLFHVRNAEDG